MTTFDVSIQEAPINIEFSGYQGQFTASYDELVACFGMPTDDGDAYKVDVRWIIGFSDGTVATVYNWKDGVNYNGDDGTPIVELTKWHIGGYSQNSVEWVFKALEARGVEFFGPKQKESTLDLNSPAMQLALD